MAKVSIGIPVYNAAGTIDRTLDSLKAQTFSDYEVIISDNASNDTTPVICREYLKKDKRIKYFRQEQNIGMIENFKFVIQHARSEYFVWLAGDDHWHPHFLETNIEILEQKKNIVASTGNIEYPDSNTQNNTSSFKNYFRQLSYSLRTPVNQISGTYQKKIRIYLKSHQCELFYSVYRTQILQRSIDDINFPDFDWSIVLNALKFGDFYIHDKILRYGSYGSSFSKNLIDVLKQFNPGIIGMIFPHYHFTYWCIKHIGVNNFFCNLDRFILLNLEGEASLFIDFLLTIKKTFVKKIN